MKKFLINFLNAKGHNCECPNQYSSIVYSKCKNCGCLFEYDGTTVRCWGGLICGTYNRPIYSEVKEYSAVSLSCQDILLWTDG